MRIFCPEYPQISSTYHRFLGFSVAVFDVLKSPDRPQPFVLLQPRPRIQDILPSFDISRAGKHNLESAYVGIVEETQSLYAMSPDRYPLVIFGDANSVDDGETAETGLGRSIDPPPPSWDLDPSSDTPGSSDLPADVDSIARKTKWKRLCHGGKSRDIRCLTGVKRLESSALSRLLDGAPAEAIPSHQNHNNQVNDEELGGPGVPQGPHNLPTRTGTPGGNTSIIPDTGGWRSNGEVGKVLGRRWIGMDTSGQAFSAFAICVVALLTALAWIGFKKRYGVVDEKKGENVARESTMKAILNVEEVGQQNGKVEDGQGREVQLPAVDQSESNTGTGDARIPGSSIPTSSPPDQTPSIPTDPQYPSSAPTLTPSSSSKTVSFQPQDEPNPREQKPTPEQPDQEEVGDGGEESEGDAPITPGKRKGPRRRRGKKKKGGATGAGANAQEEGGGAAHIEGQGGADAKVESPGMEDEFVHVVSPSAIVVPPPRPPTNTVPSLVVSDTILGEFHFLSRPHNISSMFIPSILQVSAHTVLSSSRAPSKAVPSP